MKDFTKLVETCEKCIEAFEGFNGAVKLIQFDPIQEYLIKSKPNTSDTSEVFTPDREYGWYRKFEKNTKRGK